MRSVTICLLALTLLLAPVLVGSGCGGNGASDNGANSAPDPYELQPESAETSPED